jgi:hypothetical protein
VRYAIAVLQSFFWFYRRRKRGRDITANCEPKGERRHQWISPVTAAAAAAAIAIAKDEKKGEGYDVPSRGGPDCLVRKIEQWLTMMDDDG